MPASSLAGRRGRRQFAVANEDAGLVLEVACQPLGEIDRAVLTAGTTDADGQVIAIVADVARLNDATPILCNLVNVSGALLVCSVDITI